MPSYNCWTKHGERGVMMEDNEEEKDDENYPMFPREYGDTAMEDNEEGGEEQRASDEPDDGLGRVISEQSCIFSPLFVVMMSWRKKVNAR